MAERLRHPLGVDIFGITHLYPSAPGGRPWVSSHWSAGKSYTITGRVDKEDPQRSSGLRGKGTLAVTGTGELVMGGSQPRLYLYPSAAGSWQNVEVTVYYQRVADDATPFSGLVIGVRSGPEGHGSEPCDAHTYYSRLRHDGSTDFDKELMHPSSVARSRVPRRLLWPDEKQLPFYQWIGWKFVAYHSFDSDSVQLESYRDMTGGARGGDWQLVNEMADSGGWATPTDCEKHAPVNGESDMVCLQGGATMIRNTGIREARYRWLTVREIAP